MDKNIIGKELRLIRKHSNLSLRELAELTGISYMRLGKYERGEEIPTQKMISKIESALNFDLDELDRSTKENDKSFHDFLVY